jgi:hypothetical protein
MSRGIPQDGLNLTVFEFVIPDTEITVLRAETFTLRRFDLLIKQSLEWEQKIKLGVNYIRSNTEVSTNNKTAPDIHSKRLKTRRMSKKAQQQIDWRRNKLSDYLVKGMSLPEISRVMNIPYDMLYKDQCILAAQARENMRNHIAVYYLCRFAITVINTWLLFLFILFCLP